MNIEMMAVQHVRLAIAKTDYLVPHINDNDREPSWDGDVEVYRKAGDTHSKEDLVLKVPVQIKGHKTANLKKQSIAYSVELSDLRNYLNAGGTTFLVVYVDEDGENNKIYYCNLLPFELKRLVNKFGEQKTKQITLKALPKKKNEIADVFLFAAMHMKRQRPAIVCDPISMEDVLKTGQAKLTFAYSKTPDTSWNPIDYMFDHETYIYAQLPLGLELPVDHISHIDLAGVTIPRPVYVNEKKFYDSYEVIRSKDTTELHFGKSIKIVLNKTSKKQRLNFALAGTLSERIIDEDFLVSALDAGQCQIGDTVYPLRPAAPGEVKAFDLAEQKQHLAWSNAVKALLEKLGVTKELDCTHISKEDNAKLLMLAKAVLKGEYVKWDFGEEIFPEIEIANLTIKLCVFKHEENEGYYRVFGYADAPIGYAVKDDAGKDVDISYHIFLKRDAMLRCDNIDYRKVVRTTKAIPLTQESSSTTVWVLLELLHAYDQSNDTREDLLEAAMALADWLRTSDMYTPQDLLDLNFYQTIKRARALNAHEIQAVHSMIEARPIRKDIYVGAYLILGDYGSAQKHYEQMDEHEKDTFSLYPINRFWPPHEQNSVAQYAPILGWPK